MILHIHLNKYIYILNISAAESEQHDKLEEHGCMNMILLYSTCNLEHVAKLAHPTCFGMQFFWGSNVAAQLPHRSLWQWSMVNLVMRGWQM